MLDAPPDTEPVGRCRPQRRIAPLIALGVAVVIGALFVVLAGSDAARPTTSTNFAIGKPAPGVTGTTLDGKAFDLSRRKGSWVVLNFFDPTCLPCKPEHPELVRVRRAAGRSADGAELYTITLGRRQRVPTCARFFADNGGDWPVVDDPTARSRSTSACRRCPRRGSSIPTASSAIASSARSRAEGLCRRVLQQYRERRDADDRRASATSLRWQRAKRWPGWVLLVARGRRPAVRRRASTVVGPRTARRARRVRSHAARLPDLRRRERVRVAQQRLGDHPHRDPRAGGRRSASDDEIISSSTDRDGAQLLLVPKATGLDALVWALPARRAGVRDRRPDASRSDAGNAPPTPCPTDDDRAAGRTPRWPPTPVRPNEPHGDAMNPDRLAELEEERRFLLRSLDDLEREHEAGDVDEHDFEVLRDGYTARAARVLRAIDDGQSRRCRRPAAARVARRDRRRHASPSPRSPAGCSPARRASATTAPTAAVAARPTRSASSCRWRARRRPPAASPARRSRPTSGSLSSTRTTSRRNTYAAG